jgi:hypothetical protein
MPGNSKKLIANDVNISGGQVYLCLSQSILPYLETTNEIHQVIILPVVFEIQLRIYYNLVVLAVH